MTSLNLTQVEAQQRSELLDVHNYHVALDLMGALSSSGEQDAQAEQPTFTSRTLVTFKAKHAGSTFIDLRASEVTQVVLDHADITEQALARDAQGAYDEAKGIALELSEGEHELVVEAVIPYSNTGQGLHRYVDPADGNVYLYTQFETADAKRMFACFDQPDLKATYDLEIAAPADWKVITNAAAEVTDRGDSKVHRSRIAQPLSTYLVAVCAGPYHEVTDTWSGSLAHHPETPSDQPTELTIPMGIYCRQSLAKHLDAERLFAETKQGFDFYHANFGVAYPFGKYDQLFVPEFNMGAMENAGAVTFRDEYVFSSKVTHYRYERRCDTVLHEMAHMWFGDLVTMRWWGDLWLNESFATWAAAISQAEATEYDTAWVTFANIEKSWAYEQDQLSSTHPVVTSAKDIETVEQNFDGITYAKGASLLKQLQAYVGREAFFAGVRQHFATHAFGNATFDDLLVALEQASGRDLSGWAAQWLKTTGINELAAEFTVENGKYTTFAIAQGGAQPGDGEHRTHRIAVGLYSLTDAGVQRTKHVELDVEGARTEVPELVGVEAADLVLVNDEDLTYCFMRLDPASLAFIVEHIHEITDPMARTLCWSAAWEMTRTGKMRARDFLALVARGAAHETEIAVLERVLGQSTRTLRAYADPAWAQNEGRKLLVGALLGAAKHSDAGSDKQLAFINALANTELTDEAAQAFHTALTQSPEDAGFHGLVLDTELRWTLLTALIARGDVEDHEERIAALLREHPGSVSELAALRARAAVPTEQVKQAIFDEVTDTNNTLSNLELRHKLEGLNHPGSRKALAPLANGVFERGEALWAGLSSEVALVTVTGVYPGWDVNDAAVERAEAFLTKELPGGLRRVISEGLDRQKASLRNRRFDADEASNESESADPLK